MFLRCHPRIKDGKNHRYWNIVENRRCGRGKVVQRQVLYLGEINASQHESWCRTIEVFDDQAERTRPLALFPADRQLPNFAAGFGVQIRLKEMELHRPRQWGACWLACELYEQLRLDEFWAGCLPDSREGTCWQHILQTLVCYRLIDPGSLLSDNLQFPRRIHPVNICHSPGDGLGEQDAPGEGCGIAAPPYF